MEGSDEVVTVDFRRCLLNACQDETDTTFNPEVDAEEGEDKNSLLKRRKKRWLGLMNFIGEMHQLRHLSRRVILSVAERMIASLRPEDPPAEDVPNAADSGTANEHLVECLCELLTSIGRHLCKTKEGIEVFNDMLFKLREIQQSGLYSKRIGFRIQDLLDLARNNWVQKVFSDKPMALGDVKREFDQTVNQYGGSIKEASTGTQRKVGARQVRPYSEFVEKFRKKRHQASKTDAEGKDGGGATRRGQSRTRAAEESSVIASGPSVEADRGLTAESAPVGGDTTAEENLSVPPVTEGPAEEENRAKLILSFFKEEKKEEVLAKEWAELNLSEEAACNTAKWMLDTAGWGSGKHLSVAFGILGRDGLLSKETVVETLNATLANLEDYRIDYPPVCEDFAKMVADLYRGGVAKEYLLEVTCAKSDGLKKMAEAFLEIVGSDDSSLAVANALGM